jgi:hypothetical protein
MRTAPVLPSLALAVFPAVVQAQCAGPDCTVPCHDLSVTMMTEPGSAIVLPRDLVMLLELNGRRVRVANHTSGEVVALCKTGNGRDRVEVHSTDAKAGASFHVSYTGDLQGDTHLTFTFTFTE